VAKGLPPPKTHSRPEAAALPGTLFWYVEGSSANCVYVLATGSKTHVRLMIAFVASMPPAMYNLLLITPYAKPPAGCGNGALPVRSVHMFVIGSYCHVLGCALLTNPLE
jgi:hypothetical protein